MRFEVPPSRVTPQRSLWPFAAVVVSALMIVGTAYATRGPATASDTAALETSAASASNGPAASAVHADQDLPLSGARSPHVSRTLPRQVECVDIDPAPCARVITAALRALPDLVPSVAGATIRVSLLCDAWLDCPPSHPAGAEVPLGSVSFTFEDGGSVAWVDVVGQSHGTAAFLSQATRAWVVRWIPAPTVEPTP